MVAITLNVIMFDYRGIIPYRVRIYLRGFLFYFYIISELDERYKNRNFIMHRQAQSRRAMCVCVCEYTDRLTRLQRNFIRKIHLWWMGDGGRGETQVIQYFGQIRIHMAVPEQII